MTTKGLASAALAALFIALAGSSGAQMADHLKCYKVRDATAKVRYTANLNGLAPENGCTIRVPGSMLCVAASKTGVSPTPPGGGPSGTPAGTFVCYKLRCPKTVLAGVQVTDQFASRVVAPSTPRLLCAPASGGATTTTTTSTTPSTLPPTTLPPTTLPPPTLPPTTLP